MSIDQSKLPELGVFGASVRRIRTAKGMTQERLAELAQLNPRTLQKIEAGKLNILLTTILRLQKALVCSWSELMAMPGSPVRGRPPKRKP